MATETISQPRQLNAAHLSFGDRVRANPRMRLLLALALPVGWVFFFLFIPYMFLFVQSFWTTIDQKTVPLWNIQNYINIFTKTLYFDRIFYSLGIAIRVTIFALLLAYPLAYLLAFKVKRFKTLLYMAIIIPLWVSYLVRAYAWKIILGQSGVLNSALIATGIIREPLEFLLFSQWSVIIALTHIYTPFTLIPIFAVLESIPISLKEASHDLGASRWQTFWRIIFPLSLPGVLAGSTFAFVLSFGDFIAPILLGGRVDTSDSMISNVVQTQFGTASNWPLGAALGVVILVFVITMIQLTSKVENILNYGGETPGAPQTGAGAAVRAVGSGAIEA